MKYQLQIIPIPAFKDNYIWLIHNGHQSVVVDPGTATPVIQTLKQLNLLLIGILITHHHLDHIGGVEQLMQTFPKVKVFAPKLESYVFKHTSVGEPDLITIPPLNLTFKVIDLPGHTLGHIAYYVKQDKYQWLFCGDTLFGAGCGRLFEGSPEQMVGSLHKLSLLPKQTEVYCAHEYTLNNITFALTLEPNNKDLNKRFKETQNIRNHSIPSLPSSIDIELATNPFLRCDNNEIKTIIQKENGSILEVFTAIRELRNHY